MSNNDWYSPRQSWYAPLEREERAAGSGVQQESAPVTRGSRKRKRSRILGLVVLVVILIAASSIYFASPADVGFSFVWGRDDGALPGDWEGETYSAGLPEEWEDFFEDYFEPAESITSQNNIPRAKLENSFTVNLAPPGESELTLQQLYDLCAPSIVAIYGYVDGEVGYYWGTGVIAEENGLIITNNHIIDGCDRAVVKLHDNSEYEAKLIGADAVSDLALLKIDAEGLTAAVFGDSSALDEGDPVAAIGNPLGEEFRFTLTNGIISAIDRGMNFKGQSMLLLQTNTALNEGNSGGALFNMYGQVVGITNMKMMSLYSSIEGIGFAIPSSTVKTVCASLAKSGEVRGRPSLGITVGSIPEEASEKYGVPGGLVISGIEKNSDARTKGLQPGDVITHVNFEPVESADQITAIKNTLEVGDIIMFTIWRDGESFDVDIILKDTNDLY